MGSGWPDEEDDAGDMAVVLSAGSALFPINDLARSRHCSASLSIRSTSKDALSLSSVARTESETVIRKRIPGCFTTCSYKKVHHKLFDIGYVSFCNYSVSCCVQRDCLKLNNQPRACGLWLIVKLFFIKTLSLRA